MVCHHSGLGTYVQLNSTQHRLNCFVDLVSDFVFVLHNHNSNALSFFFFFFFFFFNGNTCPKFCWS